MTPPHIRVAIVAYKSGDVLPKCLEAIACQTFSNFEVVIVNNKCPEHCVEGLVLPDDRFRVVHADDNIGFAGGSNLALLGSDSVWVATINPDARIASNVFEKLVDAELRYPEYSMVSPVLSQDSDMGLIDGVGDVLSVWGIAWQGGHDALLSEVPAEDCEVFCPSGAAAFYRTGVFEEAKGFDEELFCYLEDVDLGLRLRVEGKRCLLVSDMRVRHIGSSTLGKRHSFIWFQTYRNNVIFLIKSLPLCLMVLIVPLHLLTRTWLIWRNRRSEGHQSRVSGFWSGLRSVPSALSKRGSVRRSRGFHIWSWLEKSPRALRENRMRVRPLPPGE